MERGIWGFGERERGNWGEGEEGFGERERGQGKGPHLQFLLQLIVLSLQCVLLSGQLLLGLCLNHSLFLCSTQVCIKPDRKRRSRKVSTLTLTISRLLFTGTNRHKLLVAFLLVDKSSLPKIKDSQAMQRFISAYGKSHSQAIYKMAWE